MLLGITWSLLYTQYKCSTGSGTEGDTGVVETRKGRSGYLKGGVFCVYQFLYLDCFCFPHQAQLDLAEQNKGSVDIEEVMKEKYVFG